MQRFFKHTRMEELILQTNQATIQQLEFLLVKNPKVFELSVPQQTRFIKHTVNKLFHVQGELAQKQSIMDQLLVTIKDTNLKYLLYQIEHLYIELLLLNKLNNDALTKIESILLELKKLDDKQLLLQIYIQQSRAYYHLKSTPKSKGALVAAKTLSHQMYVPPTVQLQLDEQSGLVHLLDKEYTIAYSYFYETVEQLHHLNKDVQQHLSWLVLTQIMNNDLVISNKYIIDNKDERIVGLLKIAKACQDRVLHDFDASLQTHKQLTSDPVIAVQLRILYDRLLTSNLKRVIEPYSRVQISHLASVLNLPMDQIEHKISQMILDEELKGILDQNTGVLIIFDAESDDILYHTTIDTMKKLEVVVDSLFQKVGQVAQ